MACGIAHGTPALDSNKSSIGHLPDDLFPVTDAAHTLALVGTADGMIVRPHVVDVTLMLATCATAVPPTVPPELAEAPADGVDEAHKMSRTR